MSAPELLYQCKLQSVEGWTTHRWVPKNRLKDTFTLPGLVVRDYFVTEHYEPALPEFTFKAQSK